MTRLRSILAVSGMVCLCALSTPSDVSADINNCEDVYVGRIWIERNYGLFGVVFLNSPTDASGSYWQYFTTWTADDRKAALATLSAAKLMQHRVHLTTDESGGCSINNGNRNVKSVTLANSP